MRAQSSYNRFVNQMDFWKNRIAVVTGATSGIGAAVALDLAKAGMQVIGLARRRERVEDLARQSKGRLYAFECDISRADSIVKVFKQIGERFGRVDVLINMASRITRAPLDMNVTNEEILKSIDINIAGVVICIREAYKLMQKHKDVAYIININSQGAASASATTNAPSQSQPETFSSIPLKQTATNDAKRIKITVKQFFNFFPFCVKFFLLLEFNSCNGQIGVTRIK